MSRKGLCMKDEKYRQFEETVRRLEAENRTLQLKIKHYQEVEKINEENKKIIHDINKQLRVIGVLLEQSEDEKIKNMLKEMDVKMSFWLKYEYSNDKIVNAILLDSAQRAAEKGVKFDVDVELDFSLEYLKECDVVTMLGNLLDNALEAVESCEDPYINVRMKMSRYHECAVAIIENNYEGELYPQNKFYKTRKINKSKHGVGMKLVNDMAEGYGGFLMTEQNDGLFRANLLLPVLDRE